MINAIRQNLFSVRYPYISQLDQRRAATLLVLNTLLLIISLAWLVIIHVPNLTIQVESFGYFVAYMTPLLCVLIYSLVQRGQLQAASWFFLSVFVLGTVPAIQQGFHNIGMLTLLLPIITAGTLLNQRAIVLTTLLVFVIIAIAAYLQTFNAQQVVIIPAQQLPTDVIIAVTLTLVCALLLFAFNGFTKAVAETTLESLRDLKQVNRFLARTEDDDEARMLSEALNFVRETLGYSFAQIFLTDNTGRIDRRVRIGFGITTQSDGLEVVTVGDASALNEAALTRQPVIVSLEQAPLRRAHFLPGTFDAVALPVVYDERVVGVLDVQSAAQTGFSDDEIEVLQALVVGLAAVITRLRMIHTLRASLRQYQEENAALRLRLQTLRQAEQQTSASWNAYFQQRGIQMLGFNLEGSEGRIVPANDLPATLREVIESGQHHVQPAGDYKIVSIPISLRGETLGAMSFELPKDRPLTEKQIYTARIIAERLALALENRRLFEQTQAAANLERKASTATNLLLSATDVEAVMNIAVQSFNEALGAIHTSIHVQPTAVVGPELSEEATR